MAYTKTSGYETARQTSLETSISSGSVTSKSTRNEYSVPFNNHSAANHLITQFTLSGVTEAAGGDGDSANGVYTVENKDWYNMRWNGPSGNKFSDNGSFTTVQWIFDDTDFYPYSTSSVRGTGTFKFAPNWVETFSVYPWQLWDGGTWNDNTLSDFSTAGVFSNPVGSDFE